MMSIIKTMEELGAAIDAGAAIEFKRAVADEWMPRNIVAWPFNDIVRAVSDGRCRLTQKMTFIEGPGGRFEYPAPATQAYDNYSVTDLSTGAVDSIDRFTHTTRKLLIEQGFVHTTSENAKRHLEAYRQAMGCNHA